MDATRKALLLLILTAGCFAQTPKPCFAFLLRGDVTVSCGGTISQITRRQDIESFAVSNEQSKFAYETSRITRRTANVDIGEETTLIDLRTGHILSLKDVHGVVSTCGGLFPMSVRPPLLTPRDVISGEVLTALQPYVRFRCSADRKMAVGIPKQDASTLYAGIPPTTKIAPTKGFNPIAYAISPDGSKIAYMYSYDRLCLYSSPGPARCIDKQGDLGGPSVNDAGEVLVAVGTGKGCFYASGSNFSPKPFPGAHDEDECIAIGYWRPADQSVKTIEPVGCDPQWITARTAELLRRWSQRHRTK